LHARVSLVIDDAIPEVIVTDERSKRKTTEFCTAQCDGHRCMLVKGHDGAHEAVAKKGSLRWATVTDD
jgi:hypothetical protein